MKNLENGIKNNEIISKTEFINEKKHEKRTMHKNNA